jgi:plastocyanin
MRALSALAILSFAVPAFAGTITGMVSAKGPPVPAGQGDGGGTYGSMRYKFAEKVDYDHLADFVVYIDQPVPGAPAGARPEATIAQKDVNFDPHVLPIVVGTMVKWPNDDLIFHNVYSMSDAKEFNLGLYTKDEKPREVTFDKIGQVDVYCSIHSRMHCIILVLPSPFFAKVDANRRYTIANIPAGTYRVRAWHERLPAVTRTITVPAQGEVKADFVLGVGGLPGE